MISVFFHLRYNKTPTPEPYLWKTKTYLSNIIIEPLLDSCTSNSHSECCSTILQIEAWYDVIFKPLDWSKFMMVQSYLVFRAANNWVPDWSRFIFRFIKSFKSVPNTCYFFHWRVGGIHRYGVSFFKSKSESETGRHKVSKNISSVCEEVFSLKTQL